MHRPVRIVVLGFAAAALAGCSWFSTKTHECKSAATRTVQPLEVPPELTAPPADARYAVPDPRAQTSYSSYSQRGTPGSPAAPGTPGAAVLPKIEGARMERVGDQRWLVV